MEIKGQRVILTGAASGIGQALLKKLSEYDALVTAVDINGERLEQSVAALPPSKHTITPFVCDLSKPDEVERLFAHATHSLGGVDIFIANAGFAYYEKLEAPDWEHIEHIYRLNVFSPIYTAQKMRQLSNGRAYKIVLVASAMGLWAIPGYTLYASSKAALHRFAEGYRFELMDKNALMMVYPITTLTDFFNTAGGKSTPVPFPRQSADTVARAILRGIEQDKSAVYPSALFRAMMIMDRLLPFVRSLPQAIEKRQFEKWLAKK